MDPQFVCKADAGTFHTYRQETWLLQFHMALLSNFEHVHAFLLSRSPLSLVDFALSELLADKQM